jgi:multicomponent Na+:H+ antiporter subunit E
MLQFLVLSFAWLMWSGHYTVNSSLILAFGLLSCLAVTLLCRRMRAKAPHGRDHTLTWRTLLYLPWLAKQIVLSSLTVARLILDPRQRISPCIIRVKAMQRGEGALVLFANSITLTPGTVSLSVNRGAIVVHALSHTIADDLLSGQMNRRVSALERKA